MTGPMRTAEVRQSEQRGRSNSGSVEDEPWDQRRPQHPQELDSQYPSLDETEDSTGGPEAAMINMRTKANGGAVVAGRRAVAPLTNNSQASAAAEEEDLDDGDLPSLSTSVNKSRASSYDTPSETAKSSGSGLLGGSAGQQQKTTRPLKSGSRSARSALEMNSTTPSGGDRRKFWGQMEEDDDDGEDADVETEENTSPRKTQNPADDDGPHDEVAARRAAGRSGKKKKKRPVVQKVDPMVDDDDDDDEDDDDTDFESLPTEVESQDLEEVEEEEPYDASFCGQTLKVLDEMCGGNLNMTSSEGNTKVQQKVSEGAISPSTAQSLSPRNSRSPERSPGRSPRMDPDMQQEHTAIEVEFVEPAPKKDKSTANTSTTNDATKDASKASSDPTASDVSSKKTAYLNAMAKRAKENFRKKKRKDAIKQGHFVDATLPPKNREISSQKDKEATGSDNISEQKLSSPDGDDDYNTFSAAEKRKFVKLINDGGSAADALEQVMEERRQAKAQAETAPKGAARLAFWKKAQEQQNEQLHIGPSKSSGSEMYSATDDEYEPGDTEPDTEPEEATNAEIVGSRNLADEIVGVGVDSAIQNVKKEGDGDFPFQRSGINYYDAVRREQAVVDDSFEEVTISKKIEPSKGQRKFPLPGKPKGFSALNDSLDIPEGKRSKSVPTRDEAKVPGQGFVAALVQQHEKREETSPGSNAASQEKSEELAAPEQTERSEGMIVAEEQKDEKATLVVSEEQKETIEEIPHVDSTEMEQQTSQHPIVGHDEKRQNASSPLTSDDELSSPNVVGSRFRAPVRKKRAGSGYQKVGKNVVPSTSPAENETKEALKTENKDASKSFAPMRSTPEKEESAAHPTSADDLEMYFSSTTKNAGYSGSFGSPSISDNVSVYTAGTGVTGMTSYTASSRVRRPGAAKTRLAKQKKIEEEIKNKRQGWHETIKAAAESTNRVWDPKKGWIDYDEHDNETAAEQPAEDRSHFRIDLNRSALSHKDDKTSESKTTSGKAVPVPFPKQWEQERRDMVGGPIERGPVTLSDSDHGATQNLIGRNVPEISEERPSEIEGVEDPSVADYTSLGGASAAEIEEPLPNSDWVESMRAASAALAPKGKTWNPKHGWMTVKEDGSVVPDSVDFSGQADADDPSLSHTRNIAIEPKSTLPDQQSQSDDQSQLRVVSAAKLAPEVQSPPDDQPQLLRVVGTAKSAPEENSQPGVQSQLPNGSVPKISASAQSLSDAPSQLRVDNSAQISAELPDERDGKSTPEINGNHENQNRGLSPVPLVDTRTKQPLPNLRDKDEYPSEDDDSAGPAPMIDSKSDEFDKPLSPIVSVVKQKIGREDFNLFSDEGPRKSRSSPRHEHADHSGYETVQSIQSQANDSGDSRKRVVAAEETPRLNISIVSRDRSTTSASTRRSVGPIDVDEVDETWDSDGEDFESRISNAGNLSVNRSVVSGGSGASKPVPKLARSKRDTSPVHGARLSESRSFDTSGSQSTALERRRSPRLPRGPVPIATFKESGNESKDVDSAPVATHTNINIAPPTPADPPADPVAADLVSDQTNQDDKVPLSPRPMTGEGAAPASPSLKDRLQQWETRIKTTNSYDTEEKRVEQHHDVPVAEKQPLVGVAGWKSFLGKKVDAESAAAAAGASKSPQEASEVKEPEGHYKKRIYTNTVSKATDDFNNTDEDSLFEFKKRHGQTSQTRGTQADLNISNISPIQAKDDQSDTDDMEEAVSEAYGPTADQRQASSIFKRLSECAAPMMPTREAGRFVPPALCGRPDADEPDSVASSAYSSASADRHTRSASFGDDKPPKSKPTSPTRQRDLPVSNSSVVSEDFGAKTAYLEALAMRTAVSKPKRSSSARRERSSASSVVSSSTVHSERWKEFLEKKKATGASSKTSNSDVSRAAERYASEKVDEIMSKMASRSKSVARSRDVHKEYNAVDNEGHGDEEGAGSKTTSVQAAEDLAAARVEAMMAALSNPQVEDQIDEGEI